MAFWPIKLKCENAIVSTPAAVIYSLTGSFWSSRSELKCSFLREAFLAPHYKVGLPHTSPILLSQRASSFPLPCVSQLETIHLWVFLEPAYKFKEDKDSVSFTTLYTQQLAQCMVLGGCSDVFFKEMNEWIHEVKEKKEPRLPPRSLAKEDRKLMVAHRERNSSKEKQLIWQENELMWVKLPYKLQIL